MNRMKGKAAVVTLAAVAILSISGCSTMQNYSLNGVPMDRLYASSDQMKSDATVDNGHQKFCERNPWTCAIGGALLLGSFTWAIDRNGRSSPAPAPAPPPPPVL